MATEKPRLLPRLLWHLGVMLTVVLTAVLPLLLAHALFRFFVLGDSTVADDQPVALWLIQMVILVLLWWFFFVPLCRKDLAIWRNRKNLESRAYRQAVGKIGSSGSRTGNIVAKILLIPFILLAVATVVIMINGVLSV